VGPKRVFAKLPHYTWMLVLRRTNTDWILNRSMPMSAKNNDIASGCLLLRGSITNK
jgi:hypothetical protein